MRHGAELCNVGGGVERAGVESGEGARLARGNRALECQGAEGDGGVLGLHVGLWRLQCGQLVRRGGCGEGGGGGQLQLVAAVGFFGRPLMRLCMAVIVAWTTLWAAVGVFEWQLDGSWTAVGRRLGGSWTTVGRQLGGSWAAVGRQLDGSWTAVGRQLGVHRSKSILCDLIGRPKGALT